MEIHFLNGFSKNDLEFFYTQFTTNLHIVNKLYTITQSSSRSLNILINSVLIKFLKLKTQFYLPNLSLPESVKMIYFTTVEQGFENHIDFISRNTDTINKLINYIYSDNKEVFNMLTGKFLYKEMKDLEHLMKQEDFINNLKSKRTECLQLVSNLITLLRYLSYLKGNPIFNLNESILQNDKKNLLRSLIPIFFVHDDVFEFFLMKENIILISNMVLYVQDFVINYTYFIRFLLLKIRTKFSKTGNREEIKYYVDNVLNCLIQFFNEVC